MPSPSARYSSQEGERLAVSVLESMYKEVALDATAFVSNDEQNSAKENSLPYAP
jgi:hypothetical protein